MSNRRITPAALSALMQGQIPNYLAASKPGGIEAQEAEGQMELVRRDMLPISISSPSDKIQTHHLENLGFVFGDQIDEVFRKATLPKGWTKQAQVGTSYWTNILDADGVMRAKIFYKAAFYDRSATMRLETFFRDDTADAVLGNVEVRILARGNHLVRSIGTARTGDWDAIWVLKDNAVEWLTAIWPSWRDPLAYWDTDVYR